MVMTRSDRLDRRTRDGFVMDCPVCGAYLRWAHIEASPNGSRCTFCGTTIVPIRPDGFRDVDERLVEIEDLGLIGERLEDPPSLLEPIRGQTPRVPGWVFVVVSILAIVGMGVWRLATSPPSPASPISASGAEPSVTSTVPAASKGKPAEPVATRITAILSFDSPTWIEVTGDGTQLTSETYPPQQRLVFHTKHEMVVWLGHGSGVTLTVNGKHVSLGTGSTKLDLTLQRGEVRIGPA
jgi:RodZ C-terminal domain